MEKWMPTWRYVPIDYNTEVGCLENVTQQATFTNNLDGTAVKVRLCNRYGTETLTIAHGSLQFRNRVTGKMSPRFPLTLNGEETLRIPADTQLFSDEIVYPLSHEEDIQLNFYFADKTPFTVCCTTSTYRSWQVTHHTGDYAVTDALGFTIKGQIAPVIARDPYPAHFLVGASGVYVKNNTDAKLICMFGDSITHMSFVSDPFLEALYAAHPGEYAVMNAGISGNRLQKTFPVSPFPGGGHQFGIAGKDRFLTDVFEEAQPDIVFIMEGVNDCSHSIVFKEETVPTAQDIYDALREVTDKAHERGARVYITTVTPFGAFGSDWRDQAEALRCGYNDLIRSGAVGDSILDLDAIMRDPDDIHRMQMGMHLGDGVHPNWAGGCKMGKAIFEKWFA